MGASPHTFSAAVISGKDPQNIGTAIFALNLAAGSHTLQFVDWPPEIGIDNLTICTNCVAQSRPGTVAAASRRARARTPCACTVEDSGTDQPNHSWLSQQLSGRRAVSSGRLARVQGTGALVFWTVRVRALAQLRFVAPDLNLLHIRLSQPVLAGTGVSGPLT